MSLAIRVFVLVFLSVAALRVGTVAGADVFVIAGDHAPGGSARIDEGSDGDGVPIAGEGPRGARDGVVVLGARALFATDETRLSAAGERALERLLEQLVSRHVGDGTLVGIRVVGHTDGVGPAAYNLHLSRRRAGSVGELVARRFPDVPIVFEGAGERWPVASDATAAGRALNRRVELHVVALERP